MHRQRGVTLTGLIMALIVLAILALFAFRVGPAVAEYLTIEKVFKNMAEDPALRNLRRPELDRAWAARATVENITSLDGGLIDYTKEGDTLVISAQYERKVPLFRNVALCIDFKPSSR